MGKKGKKGKGRGKKGGKKKGGGGGSKAGGGASLLDAAWPMIEERGITLLGVSVGNLENEGAVQLTLPFERSEADRLDEAVDAVRDRFGSKLLNRAATIKGDAGFTVPMLPD